MTDSKHIEVENKASKRYVVYASSSNQFQLVNSIKEAVELYTELTKKEVGILVFKEAEVKLTIV